MSMNQVDVVGEYLREVEMRLGGLPLLQRRELLSDLHAHIASAQERGAYSEGEIIEVLERLGSPEVVAAAAYEEAGQPRMAEAAPPLAVRNEPKRGLPGWLVVLAAMAAATFLIFVIGFVGLLAFSRAGSDAQPEPAVVQVPPAPAERPDLPFPARTE